MSLLVSFNVEPWRASDAVHCCTFADICCAFARYELALAFQRIGARWYRTEVANRTEKTDSPALRQRHLDTAKDHDGWVMEYDLLISTRNNVLTTVQDHPDGVSRAQLERLVQHLGKIDLSWICQHMTKGGYLQRAGLGRRAIYTLALEPPISNQAFLDREMPRPGTMGLTVHSL